MTKGYKKGSALLLVLLAISVLLLSGAALMAKVISAGRIAGTGLHRVRALYITEAGIARARWRLGLENDLTNLPPADGIYTDEAFGGGKYTVVLSERSATEATIKSTGQYGSVARTVSIRIRLSGLWWDAAWRYRRPVTITNNTASDLTDYQVRVVIPYTAGKMKADFSDLRFVDENMSELFYWIEAVEPAQAVAWVKIPSIAGSDQTIIAAYYGNPAALSTSDMSNVMEPEYLKYDIPATWTTRTSITSIASGDDTGSWIDLQFTFPYYQRDETRCYACSNGYISFGKDYKDDDRNRSNRLRARTMIAALWDDLRTDTIYSICDEPGVYVDSYTDHILIDWEAYRRGFAFTNAAALFQVTLYRSGDILLSRGDTINDFLISETVGVSRGSGGLYVDITAESQPNRSWLFAMRQYVNPEPTVILGDEETRSPTVVLYWKEE